ncbi:MAG: rod shape-determining protein MreC, partial [Mucilaginibacter polytrichastri]|nr:rod shape-determining protein MreC [Mucilaginibacter polytrichastri]
IAIGKISKIGVKGGTNFINFEIRLSTDFARLQQVYVVKNKLQKEQEDLEAQRKKDDE